MTSKSSIFSISKGSHVEISPVTHADRMEQAVKTTAFIVLSMHRSGTSALTRVLSLLGCDLPKTLMPAGRGNELGHWESQVITDFNDLLLESAGSHWNDWLPFNSGWYRSPKADGFKERACALLAQEYGTTRLFVLKDPRICRILPFWLDVLDIADILPAMVIPVRNPLEVAASLKRRDGTDPSYGHLLWLRHMLDAEVASRGRNRFFCSYDSLMNCWPRLISSVQETVGVSLPRLSERTAEEIDSFLTEKLHNHKVSPNRVIENPMLSAWLRDSFEIFNRWGEVGEHSEDFATLDRIRADFNATAPAFSRLVASGQRAVKNAQKLEQQLIDNQSRLLTTETTAAELVQKIQKQEIELGVLRQREDEKEAELSVLRQREDEKEDALAQKIQELHQAIERLVLSDTERERSATMTNELQRQLSETQNALVESQSDANKKAMLSDAERERSISEINELQRQLSETQSALVESQCEANLKFTLLAEAMDKLNRMEVLEIEHKRLAELHAQLTIERDEAKTDLAQRLEEIVALTQRLCSSESATIRASHDAEWLQKVTLQLYSNGWRIQLASLLSDSLRRTLIANRLKRRGLFDTAAYLETHTGVAHAGQDPLLHYINHGILEGRKPGLPEKK